MDRNVSNYLNFEDILLIICMLTEKFRTIRIYKFTDVDNHLKINRYGTILAHMYRRFPVLIFLHDPLMAAADIPLAPFDRIPLT